MISKIYRVVIACFLLGGGISLTWVVASNTDLSARPESSQSFSLKETGAGRYSLHATGAPLASVLRELARQSGVELKVDPRIAAKVTVNLENATVEQLLQRLVESNALVYERQGQGYYLQSALLTSQQAASVDPAKQAEPPASPMQATLDKNKRAFLEKHGTLFNSDRPLSQLTARGSQAILLQNAIIDAEMAVQQGHSLKVPAEFAAPEDSAYQIVQFDHILSPEEIASLKAQGITISHYIPNKAYAMYVPTGKMAALQKMTGFYLAEPYHPYFKMSPEVLAYFTDQADETVTRQFKAGQFNIMLFRGAQSAKLFDQAGIKIERQEHVDGRDIVTVKADAQTIKDLLKAEPVQWIETRPSLKPMNDLAQKTVRAPGIKALHPSLNLTGTGVVVNVTDSGIDFRNPGFATDQNLPTSTNLNTRIAYYETRPGGFTADGLPGDADGHGTHVSGTILGNGALSRTVQKAPGSGTAPYATNQFAGVAPGARIVMLEDFSTFTDEEQTRIAYGHGARLSNNSWGNGIYSYGALSAVWDALVRDADSTINGNQEYIVFFSAGNDGGGNDNGTGGKAGTIGQPGNAKNVITVGALEQLRNANNLQFFIGTGTNAALYQSTKETDSDWQLAGFSSRGPVTSTDPRTKPDIVTPGAFVLSIQSSGAPGLDDLEDAFPSRDYRYGNVNSGTNFAFFSGTSMATPVACGAGTLLYQYFLATFGHAPSPAMMKALMVCGARMVNSMVYQFPNFAYPTLVDQGWGRLDMVRSVEGNGTISEKPALLDQQDTTPVGPGQIYSRTVTVNQGDGGLKVVLAWTDPAGTPGNASALVNDIDLVVQAPGGGGYLGNRFDTDGIHSIKVDPLTQPIVDAFGDGYNNVEVVVIKDALPGTYTIQVYGFAVPQGPQDYALAVMKGIGVEGRTPGDSPDIALDSDGLPVIAYSFRPTASVGLEKQIYVKKWIGSIGDSSQLGQWTRMDDQWFGIRQSASGMGISKTLEDSKTPSIALYSNNVYVAWMEEPQISNGSPRRIFFRQYDGNDWIELNNSAHDKGISTALDFDASDPVVAVAADGRPVVAWRQVTATNFKIFLTKWDGTNWVGYAGSHLTGMGGTYAGAFDMIIDSTGNPVVAWEEPLPTPPHINISRWNGASWVSLGTQGFSLGAAQPSLAAGPGGLIYLAWQQYPSGVAQPNLQIFASRYSGGVWSGFGGSATYPGVSLSTNINTDTYSPSITVQTNTVLVAWQAGAGTTNSSIFLRKFDGVSWSGVSGSDTLPGLAPVGGVSTVPALVADQMAVPFVAFQHHEVGSASDEVMVYTLVTDRYPPTFAGLITATGGINNVTLRWTQAVDNVSTVITYIVYQGTQTWACGTAPTTSVSDVFNHPIAYVTNSLSYIVSGLTPGRIYAFGVRAMDQSGLIDGNTIIKTSGPVTPGDSDGDCLDSTIEVGAGTEPCIRDTDGDGMWDGWEWTYSVFNIVHATNTSVLGDMNPKDNGSVDPQQSPNADLDNDGALNIEEFNWWLTHTYTNGCDAAGPNYRQSPDPTRPDTDGDGLADGWEMIYNFNPTIADIVTNDLDHDGLSTLGEYQHGTDPNTPDTDGDGLYDGTWYAGNPFGATTNQFEGNVGTDPMLADTDFDGLDDGVEVSLGFDPRRAASVVSFMTDGDLYQLGWTNASATNALSILLPTETFETPSRNNWSHLAPNGAMPFDFWHLSTADPDPPQTNGIVYMDDHSTNTAYRMANDPTRTNVNATYQIGPGLQGMIQCALMSPRINASGQVGVMLHWNEFYETEPFYDFVTVQARAGGDPNWVSVSSMTSGQSIKTNMVTGAIGTGWVHRVANLSQFAGMTNLQVRFLFSAQNAINNNFRGWWVDDVSVYGTREIKGWVRDENGKALEGARVYGIGRGGVVNIVQGQECIPPGIIVAEADTAQDGSYTLRGLFGGKYYLKAEAPNYRAEFYNGPLFSGSYAFGAGLNPGVEDIDLVTAAGFIDVRFTNSFAQGYFELGRGKGRSFLGVAFANVAGQRVPVYLDGQPSLVWNGSNTLATAAAVPYLTVTNMNLLSLNRPNWDTNPVSPRLLGDYAPGQHWVKAGTNLPDMQPTFELREGEKYYVNFRTNQALGRMSVNAFDGRTLPVWVDGRVIGNTPADAFEKMGRHLVTLIQTNGPRIAVKTITVFPSRVTRVTFGTNDFNSRPGAALIQVQDIFGHPLTGGVIYVNGSIYATNIMTSILLNNLLEGDHYVNISMNGFMPSEIRPVRILSYATNITTFTLYDSDADYDRVGDFTEVSGYTNIYLYSATNDPDHDGLSNLFEFQLFQQVGIRLNPFAFDTDQDGMSDGAEVGYDGIFDRFAYSTIAEEAVQGTNMLRTYFSGRYLAGVDNFGTGPVIAAIECDRFEASGVAHFNDVMPSKNQALTIFQGIPPSLDDRSISLGHFIGSTILADTRPDMKDTDGDGMWDGFEFLFRFMRSYLNPAVTNRILDPLECGGANDDPDADGLNNYEEFLGSDHVANTNDWTNPTSADSDNDGMPDGWEYFYGLNPNDPSDAFVDSDGDGLVNLGEYNFGTDPKLADTDADFLPDAQEAFFGTNPRDPDTDKDGLLDGREVWDKNLDGVPDGGFFPNWAGGDLDNDGFIDGPTDWDTDGDGMPDGFEVLDAWGHIRSVSLNPYDPTDADDDPDNDGLSNLQEYMVRDNMYGNHPTDFTTNAVYQQVIWDYSTDPFNPDTDGDGMPDGWEAINGLHPMDPIPDFRSGGLTNLYRYGNELTYDLAAEGDVDHDGLANLREFRIRYQLNPSDTNVTALGASTHPWKPDTDMDGLGDGEEDRSLAANPIIQDTDGDRLLDGDGVPGKYGEVWSADDDAVTNHFDQALNDLWQLTWSDPSPTWTRVIPDTNGPQPKARWAASATYNPVIENQLIPRYGFCPYGHPVGDIIAESPTVLMDNRQLIVLGGRDGVRRYDDVWQYSIPSNIWIQATNVSALGQVSEFGSAILFGHNADELLCFLPNPGTNGSGRPSWRPWTTVSEDSGSIVSNPSLGVDYGNDNIWHKERHDVTGLWFGDEMPYASIRHVSYSYDYTAVFGGWNPLHQYIGGRGDFFKSQDDTNSFAVASGCLHFGVADQWGIVSVNNLLLPQRYRPEGSEVFKEEKRNGLKSFTMAYAYRGLANGTTTTNATTNRVIVVFGGMNGQEVFKETMHIEPKWTFVYIQVRTERQQVGWRLSGLTWDQVYPLNSPPARWGATMAYDPILRVMILYGGFDARHRPLSDLWVYDGLTWSEVTSFTDNERPQPRGGASMVYFGNWDYDRGWENYKATDKRACVLFGGTDKRVYFDDLWMLFLSGNSVDGYTATWTLGQPYGEQREAKPSPRAFASMTWAQNARGELLWPAYNDSSAKGCAYLFGGRSGTLPTGRDTDDDLVEDGTEYELGGPAGGRDPRVNRLVQPDVTSDVIPFAYNRIGSVPDEPIIGPLRADRLAIANMEAVSYGCGWSGSELGKMLLRKLAWQGFNLDGPDFLCGLKYPTVDAPPWDIGVEAYRPDMVDLWFHRYSIEFPYDPRDVWHLGRPDKSQLGSNRSPPYAYSGRWCYGTSLNANYPNNAQMELLSPLIQLTIPPVNATATNYTTRFNLIFHEWLDLADSNDVVRVDVLRPNTGAEIKNRETSRFKPIISLVPNRNCAYNTKGQWRRVAAPIEISANETNVYFRFTLQSDSSGTAGGWYIDDVAVVQGSEISGTYTNLSLTKVSLFGINQNGNVLDTTFTSGSGNFQFGLLPVGEYGIGALGSITNITLTPDTPVVELGPLGSEGPFISSIASGMPVHITWPSVPGTTYRIEYSIDFGGSWHELATVIAGSLEEAYTDYTISMLYPIVWYRVWATGN